MPRDEARAAQHVVNRTVRDVIAGVQHQELDDVVLAARQVEIANLRKQLDEAAKLQTESKRLIELQNSQIKQLTERMQQIEKGAPAAPVAASAQPAADAAAPWYANPFVSIAGLLLIAGLAGALLIRRRR